MKNQQPEFRRKKLVIAMGVIMLGGVLSGCDNSNDPIGAGAPGTFTILANGGVGSVTTGIRGGDGGEVQLFNDGATGGAAVLLNGTANTSFTTPVTPGTADLGDNPLNIAADTTIDTVLSVVADGGITLALQIYVGTDDVSRTAAGVLADYATDLKLAAGTDYLILNDIGIYMSSDDARYSGLSVAAGATLTLGQNNGSGNSISFSHDIDNSGTITRSTANTNHDLNLTCLYYFASGNIANAGVEDAQNGGNTYISAANGIANSGRINASGFDETDESGATSTGGQINLNSGGYVINSGDLDSGGGDGFGAGGSGSQVNMNAAYTENTGAIDMSGGNNISEPPLLGDGGNGSQLYVFGDYAAYNTGAVDGSGGDGDNGGNGGYLSISNSGIGEVKNAGNVNLNGGHGLVDGGGRGGNLRMSAYGGDLLNSGDLSSVGGDTNGLIQGGGDGGEMNFDGAEGAGFTGNGDVEVSGHLNASGGNAAAPAGAGTGSGGDSGSIYLNLFDPDNESDRRVALLGYVSIDANGGDGANGGSAQSRTWVPWGGEFGGGSIAGGTRVESEFGPAQNEAPVNVRGGNSIATDLEMGWGGGAGGVTIATYDETSIDADADEDAIAPTATNTAAVDLSGGVGFAGTGDGFGGGDGGEFIMDSHHGSNNSGALNASGAAGGDSGGDGGEAIISSVSGESKNTGEIAINGADGAIWGGDGGNVEIFGATSANNVNISVNGANATEADLVIWDTFGGDGGEISITGLGLKAATNTGALSYTLGTGEEDGEEGRAFVNIECEGNCTP